MAWTDRKTPIHETDVIAFPPLPEGEFPVLLADPPWKYQNWTDKAHGASKAWYKTLSVEDVCRLPVRDVAAKNSLLFLWVTGPKLPQGLKVLESWGFEYVGLAFDWLKTYRAPVTIKFPKRSEAVYFCDRYCPDATPEFLKPNAVKTATVIPGNPYFGLGFRTRQANELCLLGKRGKGVPKKSSSVLAAVMAPRMRHSEKPPAVYDRIEKLVDGPYLELFARHARNGWESWGDEVKREV
jgi:N6-adenosine-specific RNA methylase IME4